MKLTKTQLRQIIREEIGAAGPPAVHRSRDVHEILEDILKQMKVLVYYSSEERGPVGSSAAAETAAAYVSESVDKE